MRAKIMLLPGSKGDETLCKYAEQILIDVSASFDHSFSLMWEKIGDLSAAAYGETLTQETVDGCLACKAVFLCGGENCVQELHDALNLPVRIRSLCVPEIICGRHERPVAMYVATALSLDADTLRQALRVAFHLSQEEDIRLVHVPPVGATKAEWDAAVRVLEAETRSSTLAMSAPDAIAGMISSPERMGMVLCPPYAGSILSAAGTALCSHPAMIHDMALGNQIAVYSPYQPKNASHDRAAFSVAFAVSKLLKYSLGLGKEGDCVEAAVGNVLANGWDGVREDGSAVSPDGLLELICNQISAAGELMHRGGMRP